MKNLCEMLTQKTGPMYFIQIIHTHIMFNQINTIVSKVSNKSEITLIGVPSIKIYQNLKRLSVF